MRFATLATALTASSVVAGFNVPGLRTIKLSPTEIQQVTEEEKWALRAVSAPIPTPKSGP